MSARLDGGRMLLRHGRWQDVLADVEADAVIVDAPYSVGTHSGHDGGRRNDGSGIVGADGRETTRGIDYQPFSLVDVLAFVEHWHPRTRGWFATITDHVLAPVWANALEISGRYVFAPIPIVEVGGRVRLTGDGPSSWTCWLVVARPRTPEFARWGTLLGAYIQHGRSDKAVMGGKPLAVMRSIVRDYTRRGDVVVDPCAGGATTLLAAAIEGRNAVGAEVSAEHFATGQRIMAAGYRGYTPPEDDGTEWLRIRGGTTSDGSTSGCSDGGASGSR